MDRIVICRERPEHRGQVFEINRAAFESDMEARLVDAVRGSGPSCISLVALDEERVVGHVLFTPVQIGATPSDGRLLALGPMCVRPDRQRQGIGGRLVGDGLAACRSAGAAAVFVLGHADYYPRFGFQPAAVHDLRYKGPEFALFFFVIELEDRALEGFSGLVEYLPEFDGVS